MSSDPSIPDLAAAITAAVGPAISAAIAPIAEDFEAQLTVAQANQPISPGTDLGPLLAKADTNQAIFLKPGASYMLTGSPTLAAGVSLIGDNSSIVITPVPAGTSGIAITNPNCSFLGLNFSAILGTKVVALHIWVAGTNINECGFDGSLNVGVQTEAAASNTTIARCNFGIVQAQGVYSVSDNLTVQNCTFAGSIGEHPIRIDVDEVTGRRPGNATISHCNITNHNVYGKEAIAVRECIDFAIVDTTVDGWLRFGQGNSDNIVHATGGYIRNLILRSLRPGPNGTPGGSLIQIEHDVNAILDGVTAPGSITDPLASVMDRSTLYTRELTLTGNPVGQNFKVTSGTGNVVRLS